MSDYRHEVSVITKRPGERPVTIDRVVSFELTLDLLELGDPFHLSLPFDRQTWDAVREDNEVEIRIDGVQQLSGLIDDRKRRVSKRGGATIEVDGRDRGGRILDESALYFLYKGIGVKQLAENLVGDWFETVSLGNAENRRLIRGAGRKQAMVSSEPPIQAGRSVQKKVEPGESRASVLTSFLEEADLLAWSSADGKSFIVGYPNYAQKPQWRFFAPTVDSPRAVYGNVTEFEFGRSVGERYSAILACGSSRGNSESYGPNVTRRSAVVRDGPNADGTGRDFAHPKRLIVTDDDIRSTDDALFRAGREMAIRNAGAKTLSLTVDGWGQQYHGSGQPTLFAFDTVAEWTDEEIDEVGEYLVTQVTFRESKDSGQVAELELVPTGTALVIS